MLILAPTKRGMARLDGQNSRRELQARVNGSKLVTVDGVGHGIYVGSAEECQKALLEFLGALR
jgi:pimeloyl-ACP methyl ester carboxylesterase